MADQYCIHNQLMNDFIDENFDGIRAPFTAGFELTCKCNLNCVHCYAKPGRGHKDMSLHEFKEIFNILVERGLLDCYFTGGEIFLRPDFEELFVHAKKSGVLISLLSNITLLSQKHIDLFKEYPVEVISTSMYGYNEESYENVTGVKGSFKKFMDALELLQKNDIKYELKFVAMEQNIEDLYKVREFGNKLGVPMVVILDVHPMSDGSTEPVALRLTPEQAFEFDVKDEGRNQFWKGVARELLTGEIQMRPQRTIERFSEGYLYPCSIANQHVFITSDLKMQGCVRASYGKYDLRRGSFDEGWKYLQDEFVKKKSSDAYKCNKCENIRFCEHCVANFKLAYGDEERVDTFFCRVAELRRGFVETEIKRLLVDEGNGWRKTD